MPMDRTILWSSEILTLFKKVYTKAVNEKAESFFFMGHEFVTGYAKYLIQYLEQRLKDKP
jgi:hypothetical protein